MDSWVLYAQDCHQRRRDVYSFEAVARDRRQDLSMNERKRDLDIVYASAEHIIFSRKALRLYI